MQVTMDHVRQAVKWAKGEEKICALEGRTYYQAEIDCGTACCVWGAACIIAGTKADALPIDEWKTTLQNRVFADLAGICDSAVLPLLDIVSNASSDLSDLPDMLSAKNITVVLRGSPAIECESGGYVFTHDTSAPTIKQSGGNVFTHDTSTPTITQSGGNVRTFDMSAPTITQTCGNVFTHDTSTPIITQSGGGVFTHDTSTPIITQSGGGVFTYDASTPIITLNSGEVRTQVSSAPTITQKGGEVFTHDTSTPTIKQSGGNVRTCGTGNVKVIMVEKK